MTWRPRLRTILLLVNLVLLALPLGGIAVLRLYESALVRQTESELIAQGAFIASAYRAAFARNTAEFGAWVGSLETYGRALAPRWRLPDNPEQRWRPRPPVLDLAVNELLAPQPEPKYGIHAPDPLAAAVGNELTPILQDAQVVTLAGIRVLDYRGTIVASTAYDVGLSLADALEATRSLNGEPLSLLRARVLEEPPPPLNSISRGSSIRVIVTTPIVAEGRVLGVVVLARTPSDIIKALYAKRQLLLQAALALLAIALLLTLFTSLTITRPLRALVRQAERARHGAQGAMTPLQRPVTREVAQLSTTLAAMAETLERRAEYIRSFAAHVSHEFKTPLTAMKGALELLREHFDAMSPEQRAQFLANTETDVERLERLVRRLLELARADVMRAGRETADGAAVSRRVAMRFQRNGLHLQLNCDTEAMVAIGADTLDAILSHLLDNASHHAGERPAARLLLRRGETGDVTIVISDSGPGVSESNSALIFEPFFTTSRGRGGTGLGLAIVKALLAAHGGSIELQQVSVGACFRITLPGAG